MTLFFQSHQITIYRLRPLGAAKQNYSATFTVYPADIQPLEGQRLNEVNGRVGKTYEAFVDPDVAVKEADQIVSSGVRYSVKSVSTWGGAGLLDHKHLILEARD